jgi:hypothetical protein
MSDIIKQTQEYLNQKKKTAEPVKNENLIQQAADYLNNKPRRQGSNQKIEDYLVD